MSGQICVRIEAEDDASVFWRSIMALDAANVACDRVVFTMEGNGEDLFGAGHPAVVTAGEAAGQIPQIVHAHLDKVLLHKSPERLALAYRLLRRWRANPNLFAIASDADVARAAEMTKSVQRDMHKMTAFVRFREVASGDGVPAYVAWFEPEHHIVAATAPFFVKRFASMRWSILTPRRSAHWDGVDLVIGEGRARSDAAAGDPLEEVWKTYYAHIFNPARLKVEAMRAQMPKKYWKNLPEAELIAPLIATARARSEAMIALGPSPQRKRRNAQGFEPRRGGCAGGGPRAGTLEDVDAELDGCQRCPIYASATQAVPGEGPPAAQLMIVGEQPGDQEDLARRPFVGPAGKVLDAALERTGIARAQAYVTNAVKHFKHEARGKARLHKSPNASEIDHCRWWLDLEISIVKPELIVGLGGSAARAILRESVAVKDVRGQLFPLAEGRHALITIHPSYLLRLKNEDEKRVAWRAFLDDLSRARDWLAARAAA